MFEDWAAVSRAINERVEVLGWRQRELAERSQVSQAIVREIQHHTVERRRSARTLEALSIALGLHPQHLTAVLNGTPPPAATDPVDTGDPLLSRLDAVERRLSELTTSVRAMRADLSVVAEHLRRKG
ncbi:helix-turn-helix domain-containing protein [Actinokineospora pegani]|uniref:helix-turn-helix domain-containing protein n=1 Tax=Actinokineospora pegani TaxID=2654637 RepID=UPI0012EAADC8|nr:helix-turn-helix transcriptional regulator [Actinokineospora pegani]